MLNLTPIGISALALGVGAFLVSVGVFSGAAAASLSGPISGVVDEVIDGDTVRVRVDIWIDQQLTTSVRLEAVDTPEITGAKCENERRRGEAARSFAKSFLKEGEVTLSNVERGKYAGRVVAKITRSDDGADLGEALLRADLARPYGRNNWCG